MSPVQHVLLIIGTYFVIGMLATLIWFLAYALHEAHRDFERRCMRMREDREVEWLEDLWDRS